MTHSQKSGLMAVLSLTSILMIFFLSPIAQNPDYHRFADQRLLLGIPHAGDVLTNIPFTLVGCWGLVLLVRFAGDRTRFRSGLEVWPLAVAFLGIALVGPGSGYYHWNPDNATLFWDRLPIAVAFMGVLAMVICERIDTRAGLILLPLLVLASAFSVYWWRITELEGAGDLRLYGWAVFFPLVALPAMVALFPARYSGTRYLMEVLGWYAAAKAFEALDAEVFHWSGGMTSGHNLKHLLAAAATWSLVRYLRYRRVCATDGDSQGSGSSTSSRTRT